MTLIGNIIWLIFGGFLAGIGYMIGGLLVCLTIIGIPLGRQAIKIGWATMAPFGKEIVVTEGAGDLLPMVFNILWAIFVGWEIALSHLIFGVILFITVIGIPFAKQHFKLMPLALFPFGRELRG